MQCAHFARQCQDSTTLTEILDELMELMAKSQLEHNHLLATG
jgi:hypothetical protein